jgi:hypothetical protein
MENAKRLESDAKLQVEGKSSFEALSASIDIQTQRLLVRNVIDHTDSTMDAEIDQVLKEAQFNEEYKLLQERAMTGEDVIDAEFVETGDPVDKAKKLLTESAIGGLSGVRDSFTIKQPEPIKAKVETEEEPDKRD